MAIGHDVLDQWNRQIVLEFNVDPDDILRSAAVGGRDCDSVEIDVEIVRVVQDHAHDGIGAAYRITGLGIRQCVARDGKAGRLTHCVLHRQFREIEPAEFEDSEEHQQQQRQDDCEFYEALP